MNITFKNKWMAVVAAILVVALMTTKAHADDNTQSPDVATLNVATLTDLQAALANPVITTINVTADIPTTVKLVASTPVTINGGGHTISFSEITPTHWEGDYVLQVYNTTATLNDIKLTGGNAALLVNGSAVTLTGTIDVSGNGFGGIEVSRGTAANLQNSALTVSGTLLNSTEAYSLPTIWTVNGQGTVTGGPSTTSTAINTSQTQYYINAANATTAIVNSASDFNAAMTRPDITTIQFGSDITTTSQLNVTRAVTIDGNNHKLLARGTKVDGTNNSGLGIINVTGPVIIKNLTEDGTGRTSLHGFNLFDSTNVSFDNITSSNNGHTGICVNGSVLSISNVTTSNNGWGGIDVDAPADALPTSTLTLAGNLSQTESVAGIVKDDNSKAGVSVVDPNNQLASTTYTHDTTITGTIYTLKNQTVLTEAGLRAALANPLISTISFGNNITIGAEVTINRAVTIDGAGHTLFASINNSANSNSNNAGLGIIEDSGNVTINNLTIDGLGSTNIHDINIFDAGNVMLDGVIVKNASKAGITVNGANVTVNNITTSGNAWGGINADQASDAHNPTVLNITGTSHHTETGPHLWKDDNTKSVTVNTNGQYTSQTYTHGTSPVITGTAYTLIAQQSSTASAPQVTVTSPTQAVVITVDSATTNPSIDVHSLVTAGTATLPQITITSTTANVSIPAATVVTSTDTSWNGIIAAPTVTTSYTLTPDIATAAHAVLAIEVGAGNTPLTFSNAVKLTFAGQANNLIGWSQAGSFHAITSVCDDPATPTLAAGADCRVAAGADLIVWTKHFTTFVTYTETAVSSGGISGGGTTGPTVSSVPAPSVAITHATAPVGQVLGAQSFHFTLSLKSGARSDEVLQLQNRLAADGYAVTADGKFGPKTKVALMKWQKAHKLSADGQVGPKTRAALNA
jgi:hypothetical protein